MIQNDLIKVFQDGLTGKNRGLPTGLSKLDRCIYGVQKGVIIGVAGSPKSGKSTFADSAFMINPYIYSLDHPEIDMEMFYWSLELSKTDVRFRSIAHFFNTDYNIATVQLENGRTHKGKNIISMSPSYLLGKLQDDDGRLIIPTEVHQNMFNEIVQNRIIPMFGEYNEKGDKIKKGKIDIIEDINDSNPTGIYNYLMRYASENGKFLYEDYISANNEKKQRIVGYEPNNPDKYVIIIVDHLRNLKRERNYTLKQNMDKLLEYEIILRNICGFTFVDVLHLNRNISDITRIKFNNEFLYPNDDDLKDSGNLSEVADYLLTIFDANDERYNIKKHFGLDITNIPNYRSIHLVRSRHSEAPAHIQTRMFAGISQFEQI